MSLKRTFNLMNLSKIALITAIVTCQLQLLAAPPLPPPPQTGTPQGNHTPGTTRAPNICPVTPQPLTALMANRGDDFTVAEYPKLWFYVPYSNRGKEYLEFSLFDGRERQLVYRTAIELPDRPGMIQFKIPTALKQNQTYRWYLNFDCDRAIDDGFDLFVSGWIERVEKDRQVVWYDAIDDLASRYFTNPTNPQLKSTWGELLTRLNAAQLINAPLVDRLVGFGGR